MAKSLYIGQRFYRTRITPKADAPSEHLFEQINVIVKTIRFNPLNPFDPRSIFFLVSRDRDFHFVPTGLPRSAIG